MLTPAITEFGFRVCAIAASGLWTSEAAGAAMSASFPISRRVYNIGG
jgi:hypothetical protein